MSGGFAHNPGRYLDSTEMLIEDQNLWTKVNGLTLPSVRRGPFMINLNNNVFLTGLIELSSLIILLYKKIIGGEITDEILKLTQESLTWTEVGRMKKKRGWHKGSVIDLTGHLLSHCT